MGQVLKYDEYIGQLSRSIDKRPSEVEMANAQVVSVVRVLILFLEHLLKKCIASKQGAASLSNYSHMHPVAGWAGKDDSSSVTVSENMMDRSFDDDNRNLFE